MSNVHNSIGLFNMHDFCLLFSEHLCIAFSFKRLQSLSSASCFDFMTHFSSLQTNNKKEWRQCDSVSIAMYALRIAISNLPAKKMIDLWPYCVKNQFSTNWQMSENTNNNFVFSSWWRHGATDGQIKKNNRIFRAKYDFAVSYLLSVFSYSQRKTINRNNFAVIISKYRQVPMGCLTCVLQIWW